MKGGNPMLDDLRQDKTDLTLDPLSEGTSLPWSKKVALLCLAVALIGLFIFFTSDSWSSDSKHSKHMKKGELVQEIDAIKARLTDLEMKMQPQPAPTSIPTADTTVAPIPSEPNSAVPINLQSLIEQELQESHAQASAKENEQVAVQLEDSVAKPAKKKAVTQPTGKKQQNYTVLKGDSLSKISHKFYGSTKYWKRIVEANKDKLGHSQTLRPGMVLVIPKDEEK